MISARLFYILFISLIVFCAAPLRAQINAPSGMTGSWTPSQFTVSWTDNSNNESGFIIAYRVGTTGQFTRWANVGAGINTYSTAVVDAPPCLNVQWAIFAFTGPANNFTETSPSSNIITMRAPLIESYASPLGQPFSYFLRMACEPAATFTATGLPAGLTLNAATREISGTPTAPAGNYTVSLNISYGSPVRNEAGRLSIRLYQFQARPAQAPATQAIPALTFGRSASASNYDLTAWFSDPDATSAVRVVTSEGNLDFGFFGNAAPLTVANFMNYVNRGDFANSFFHRSVPGFVIQGGGFRATTPVSPVPTDPPVQNEFNPANSNLGGTISMAKSDGNPNSATCQFFVSLDNNASILDGQNGGFTVFGRVAGSGMNTAFAIARKPLRDWTGALGEVPVNTAAAGDTYNASQLITITSVSPIAPLTWQAQSSNPAVCAASVAGSVLSLTPGAETGTAAITITATDLDGLTVQQTVQVSVWEHFAIWAARQNFAAPADATPDADPDKDGAKNFLEYAWLTDPKVSQAPQYPSLTTPSVRMALTFPVRKGTGTALRYTVLASDRVDGGWQPVWSTADGFTHARVAAAVDAVDRTTVTITDSVLMSAGTRRFLRVEVEQTQS